jgi:hypothetical protein
MANETTRDVASYQLARLDDLDDFKIAEGDPDPRGWDVQAADGRTVGKVDTLIADTGAMKVRYLDVALDEKALGLEEPRHILIPIGGAMLDEKEDAVYLGTLPSARLRMLPPYRHTALTRPEEQFYRQRFDSAYTPAEADADFYAHEHFDDSRFFGRRRRRDDANYLMRSR